MNGLTLAGNQTSERKNQANCVKPLFAQDIPCAAVNRDNLFLDMLNLYTFPIILSSLFIKLKGFKRAVGSSLKLFKVNSSVV